MRQTVSGTAPSGVGVPPSGSRRRARRGCGTAIFWCAFVLIFTTIFYLGYLVLLSMQDSDRAEPERAAEEVADERGDESPTSAREDVAQSDAASQPESEEGRDVSPFANVFKDDPSPSSKPVEASTLREWRNQLRAGLASASELSEKERAALRGFAIEARDYAKYYESEQNGANLTNEARALLVELRELAERGAREFDTPALDSTAFPLLQEAYEQVPFDESTSRVPPDYKGHDIIAVASALAEHGVCATLRQSGESERAYVARLERLARELAQESLFGETTFDSRFAFVMPNFEVRADADGADVVQIAYSPARKSASIQKDEFADDVSLYRKIVPDYERRRAENSVPEFAFTPGAFEDAGVRPFGLRYRIESSSPRRVRLYGLAIKLNKKTASHAHAEFHLRLNRLPPKEGEELARNGCVLCVCALDAEGTNDYYSLRVSNGKMLDGDGKTLYTQTDYLLTVSDVEFWLYNGKTGEVYAKYSCEDALKGKTHYYDAASDGN